MTAPTIANRLARRLGWEAIDSDAIRQLVDMARREDLEGFGLREKPDRTGDVTSEVLERGDVRARAHLVARDALILCGSPLVPLILNAYGSEATYQPAFPDGQACRPGDRIGTITGSTRQVLQAERVLLNFLQRLSGVASITSLYVAALGDSSTRLLDTRKTTPGFRVLEKYAVACGGGFNHRMGLFDRVMLKDNHLAADKATQGQALKNLVENARVRCPGLVIQVEVDSIDQIPPALEAGAEVLLLDNFTVPELKEAVALISGQAATEASGGITLETLPALAQLGLDFISTGATVHQAVWKDIALDWES